MGFYDNGQGYVKYSVVVQDSDGDVLAAYGSFDTESEAEAFTPPPGMTNDCIVVPLYEDPVWEA